MLERFTVAQHGTSAMTQGELSVLILFHVTVAAEGRHSSNEQDIEINIKP
jgi:hypothetical protein